MGVIRPTSWDPVTATRKGPWPESSELMRSMVDTPRVVSWVGVSCMPARSVLGNSCQSYGNDVILQRERGIRVRGGGPRECRWKPWDTRGTSREGYGLSGREGRARAARGTDKPLGLWGHIGYKRVKKSIRAKGWVRNKPLGLWGRIGNKQAAGAKGLFCNLCHFDSLRVFLTSKGYGASWGKKSRVGYGAVWDLNKPRGLWGRVGFEQTAWAMAEPKVASG
jgi:hypothetical protein